MCVVGASLVHLTVYTHNFNSESLTSVLRTLNRGKCHHCRFKLGQIPGPRGVLDTAAVGQPKGGGSQRGGAHILQLDLWLETVIAVIGGLGDSLSAQYGIVRVGSGGTGCRNETVPLLGLVGTVTFHLKGHSIGADHVDGGVVGHAKSVKDGVLICRIGAHVQGYDGILHAVEPVALRGYTACVGAGAGKGGVVALAAFHPDDVGVVVAAVGAIVCPNAVQRVCLVETPAGTAPCRGNIDEHGLAVIQQIVEVDRLVRDHVPVCLVDFVHGEIGYDGAVRKLGIRHRRQCDGSEKKEDFFHNGLV